jgi:glutamate-1-semialdehyde 2,1-aminomutase
MIRSSRTRYQKSEKLFAAASRILPGGVDSPVRAFKSVGATPLFVSRARGAILEDADGHKYIDYVMSWGPLIHGHAPKGLLKALAAAASRGTSFGAPTELETRLAQRVALLMPSMERVRFVSSGTEAAMSAIRVARAATKRDRIVKFEGCYHGHADSFLVQAGSGAMTLGVPTSPGVAAAAAADTLLATYNDLDSVERVLAAHSGQVAAIVVEPIAGNMGLVPPRDGFLHGLRGLADRHKALLVFDEVISGFRAGTGGAQKIFGIRPDLTWTLSGNPLAMTAGLWSLQELSPSLYKHLARLGGRLAAGLADAARRANVPLQVNAFGSLVTPFFTEHPVRDYQSALRSDTKRYAAFFRGMLARGVYPPPSQFEAWFLSGAHTTRHVDTTIKAAYEAMKKV